MLEMICPANLLTGAEHPAFSRPITGLILTKLNCN